MSEVAGYAVCALYLIHKYVCTVHRVNGMKGSIYMVFDYMDHDLTGLMEREGHRFTVPQVSIKSVSHVECSLCCGHHCLW